MNTLYFEWMITFSSVPDWWIKHPCPPGTQVWHYGRRIGETWQCCHTQSLLKSPEKTQTLLECSGEQEGGRGWWALQSTPCHLSDFRQGPWTRLLTPSQSEPVEGIITIVFWPSCNKQPDSASYFLFTLHCLASQLPFLFLSKSFFFRLPDGHYYKFP